MKITIMQVNDDIIATSVDLSNVKEKGQISHAIAELERIKIKLLKKWESMLND